MKFPKIKPDRLYKVEWLDIQNFSNTKLKKPYSKYLCKSWTIGKLYKGDGTLLVINAGNEDDDICGDAIPINCVTNITII